MYRWKDRVTQAPHDSRDTGRSPMRSTVTAALLCLAALAPATAPAKTLATTRVVARTGDPSPDGTGSLFLIEPPIVLGASGQVAFSSDIRDQGFLDGFGIFRCSNATDLTLIARSSASGSGPVTGWPAPDGNGYFYPFDAPSLAINGSGEVVFAARLTGTLDPAEGEGIFLGSGGQAGLVQIARGNELVPGGSDRIAGLEAISGAAPSLNDAGEVAFHATVGAPSPDGQAILRGDGTPGSLVEIARTQLVPGPTETPLSLSKPAPLNQTGDVAFAACFFTGCGGIFRGSGGQFTEIARSGEASPDGNGSFGTDLGLRPPAFNESGEAAFLATLTGTAGGSSDNVGIFRGDGTSLAVIARRGDFTPGGNGRLLDIDSNSMALDDLGQVLFTSTITGALDGSSEGVFRGDGQSLLTIARIGDPAPGGVGLLSGFEPRTLALNENGQAVFQAFIDLGNGGGTNDTEGLFFFDDVRGLLELARIGDVVPGAGVVGGFDFAGGTTSQGAGTSGLNAQGEVAYRLAADGNYHVVIVPEPGEIALESAAGVALLLLDRRARRPAT
jgi:hypothetical protein